MRIISRALVAYVLFLLACSTHYEWYAGEIHGITRVFWHERTHYSFHVRDPGEEEIEVVSIKAWDSVRLVADVPAAEPMWASFKAEKGSECGHEFDGRYRTVVIHVHHEKDVEGAGWNHGKFGSGNTQVIE